jgi:hypothetical protein
MSGQAMVPSCKMPAAETNSAAPEAAAWRISAEGEGGREPADHVVADGLLITHRNPGAPQKPRLGIDPDPDPIRGHLSV